MRTRTIGASGKATRLSRQGPTLRLATGAFFLVLGARASAQFDPSMTWTIQALREQNLLRDAPRPPLGPEGFPNPEPKRSDQADAPQQYELVNADTVESYGPNVKLTGNVEFVARGYRVRCDEAEGNRLRQVFTCRGNVLIVGNGQSIVGDRVTIDLVAETYVAERFETQLSPSQLQNQVTAPIYVTGRLSSGTQRLNHTQDGRFTTCPLDDPHFGITGRDVEVRTGKRIIFRDAKFQLFGKTIFQLPFLVVPLDDPSYRYSPYVGQTEDEGYFVKNTIGVPIRGDDVLITRVDEMQKLGTGLGFDYGYALPGISGVARVYKIFGSASDQTFNLNHRQAFRGGTIAIDNDYQHDNHLVAPGQTLLNTRATVTFNNLGVQGLERATSRLTLNRNSSDATSYSSVNQTIGAADQRNIGRLRTDAQVSLVQTATSYASGSDTSSDRLQTKLQASQDIGLGTASLLYQRTLPVGNTTSSSLGSSDLTPVLSLQSDSRHLLGEEQGRRIPFKTDLSWGQYVDNRNSTSTERTSFGLAYARNSPSQDRLTFDTNANFRQGIYSDDTAQYILGLNENVRYKLGNDTGINLRYGYLRPYGYTPLSIDSTGQTNYFSTDINARPLHSLLLGLQTGYDLLRLQQHQIAWQQVGLRSEWTPRSGILLRGLYTYDTYNQLFSQLRFDASFYGRETRATLNAQYDGAQHTWSTFNGTIDGWRIGRTKVAALFSYNGYLQEFETKQYAFTYDLHCAEAVLTVQENNYGFRPGRQITFLLRLKALPFDLPFGIGNRGQSVGYGSGTRF